MAQNNLNFQSELHADNSRVIGDKRSQVFKPTPEWQNTRKLNGLLMLLWEDKIVTPQIQGEFITLFIPSDTLPSILLCVVCSNSHIKDFLVIQTVW